MHQFKNHGQLVRRSQTLHLALCSGHWMHCHLLLALTLELAWGEVANIVIHVAVLPQANGVWPPVLTHGTGGVAKRQLEQKATKRTSGL